MEQPQNVGELLTKIAAANSGVEAVQVIYDYIGQFSGPLHVAIRNLTAERDQLRAENERLRVKRDWLESLIVDAHYRAFGQRHYAYVDPRTACDLLVADITTTQWERDEAQALVGELRGKLESARAAHAEWAKHTGQIDSEAYRIITAALTTTGPQALGRLRAEVLLEAANKYEASHIEHGDEHARRIKAEALQEVSKELRAAINHVMCGCYNESDIGGLQLALAKIAQLEKDSEECLKCSYANVAGEKVVYQRCADCDAEADRLEVTNGQ